jgi:hypothetical protein
MAENSDRTHQTQAFLQEIDRQHLNKACLRIIDLRGRVAGECQQYEFGGRKHYLDDRAYLLVKQLMARFDGRYTNGVYETLFKALKQLGDLQEQKESSASTPSLFLKLDQQLHRAATRVAITTAIQIRIADVLYNAHTLDLTTDAVRASMKKAFTLAVGDEVQVDFSEWFEKRELPQLKSVPYRIIKLDEEANHTMVVMIKQEHADPAFDAWLHPVLDKEMAKHHVDVDNELINLQCTFYQRLWLAKLAHPVFWLQQNDIASINAIHLQPPAEGFMDNWSGDFLGWVQAAQFTGLTHKQTVILAAFDNHQTYHCDLNQTDALKALVQWAMAAPSRQLLLITSYKAHFKDENYEAVLAPIRAKHPDLAHSMEQQWQQSHCLVTALDLRPLFSATQTSDTLPSTPSFQSTQALPSIPKPSLLEPFIQRNTMRYNIRTEVTVRIGNRTWQTNSLDVSAEGLAISLPLNRNDSLEPRAYVDFTGWQKRTKKVTLTQIPFAVTNTRWWDGQLRIGLNRIKSNCAESINQYFDWVIEENARVLKANYDDIRTTAESTLYGEVLLQNLPSIPVFMWVDERNKRHIEKIGQTEQNKASSRNYEGFWPAFEATFIQVVDTLKKAGELKTGLYAYATHGQWSVVYEHQFETPRSKQLFLQRCLAAEAFVAFHCSFTSIKPAEIEYHQDLMSQLQAWHQQRAHKVKAFRQRLRRLFGLVLITDVTQLVRAVASTTD